VGQKEIDGHHLKSISISHIPRKGIKTMNKNKTRTPVKPEKEVKETKELAEANARIAKLEEELLGKQNVNPVPESSEESVGDIKDHDERGGFKIDVKPNDSPKVKKAKLKAIFAADKAQNPERYARKNKDAELEKKLSKL